VKCGKKVNNVHLQSSTTSFTYGQYVFIELADKLYNSVTVCFCALRKYVFHIGLKWEPNVDYRGTTALIVARRLLYPLGHLNEGFMILSPLWNDSCSLGNFQWPRHL
jgi:hypothetical protein